MKANHEYVLRKCNLLVGDNARVLDYGCGKGIIVEEGIKRGIDFLGVEAYAFGSGTNIKKVVENSDVLRNRIRELDIEENIIPFPEKHFDLVVSNQVFEHVVDMDTAIKEIKRVLKEDGKVLFIFPSKECWREGHCGVYFAHWMPKCRLRYYWLLLNRLVGVGRLKRGRTRRQWADFFNNWLVDSVTYRKISEIHSLMNSHYSDLQHLEDDYLSFRLSRANFTKIAQFSKVYPFALISNFIVRKRGSLVIVAHNSI